MDGITDSMDMSLSKVREIEKDGDSGCIQASETLLLPLTESMGTAEGFIESTHCCKLLICICYTMLNN